jgi:hypothetical protein
VTSGVAFCIRNSGCCSACRRHSKSLLLCVALKLGWEGDAFLHCCFDILQVGPPSVWCTALPHAWCGMAALSALLAAAAAFTAEVVQCALTPLYYDDFSCPWQMHCTSVVGASCGNYAAATCCGGFLAAHRTAEQPTVALARCFGSFAAASPGWCLLERCGLIACLSWVERSRAV